MGATYTIRYRARRGYSREAQGHATWNEWQVVQGRKVVARFDLERQAKDWIAARASLQMEGV